VVFALTTEASLATQDLLVDREHDSQGTDAVMNDVLLSETVGDVSPKQQHDKALLLGGDGHHSVRATKQSRQFAPNSRQYTLYMDHLETEARRKKLDAFPGYGEGSVKLWHCNKDIEGFVAISLYLQNGDFRTQAGSIHASEDLVTSRYITIEAMPGHGSGNTKLWYSATGKGDYRSNTLYVANGDFHTEAGSIHAGQDLHAGRFLKIAAWPGHGEGYASLWHSKTEHQGFGADTLYLETGHFQVQKGSLVAAQDVYAGRYIKVGAKQGFGTGSTHLWYSGSGKDGVFPHTLYLESGDFRTQAGDIRSAKDVVAGGTLYGANLNVKYAYVPGQITAGHLFLGGNIKPPSSKEPLQDAVEMVDVDSGDGENAGNMGSRRNVGEMLRELSDSNDRIVAKNNQIREDLQSVLSRLENALAKLK